MPGNARAMPAAVQRDAHGRDTVQAGQGVHQVAGDGLLFRRVGQAAELGDAWRAAGQHGLQAGVFGNQPGRAQPGAGDGAIHLRLTVDGVGFGAWRAGRGGA